MDTYCIMCAKKKDGIEVKEDHVLGALRWVKRNITKDEKRNRLVVCKECYLDYKKRRSKYTGRQILYLVLGFLFVILGIAISPSLQTIGLAMLLLVILYLISLLNYTPSLSIKEDKKKKEPKHKQ